MAAGDDLELADEKKGGGKFKKILIIVLAAMLVVGLSVAVTLYFMGAFEGDSSAKGEADSKSEKQAEQEKGPPIYLALTPEFIVNFEDQSQASFLQVEIQVMSHKAEEIKALEEHMPVVRNNILLLLSNQKYELVRTREGKDKLRAEILSSLRDVLKKESGKAGIEAVYFTSFIMQ